MGNIDDGTYRCSDGSTPEQVKQKMISGVLGAASSVTSIQVANLLRLFKIPQLEDVYVLREKRDGDNKTVLLEDDLS
ncbi:hypothetical protein IscW_ISCW002382 [Ixodes scapularis]|uniref:Uncharacterized protein n=1 Tax=Ixodes scapularis TaxID=6945 RepID=B7PCZ1_IXOSC|nr:hypothetical protein IscW_ISCW002382 [Ixodes scapularis]|eukprot:XP_002410450.1 hypothetical protein IscW_ISCW002382 [Ixodes scapularis]